MIRVLIAEDQALLLGALAALLKLEDDIDVVGTAGNGKDALDLCRRLRPDVVLTDIEMPLMTGLELAACLAEEAPACRVMIVTTFGRSGYLRRALASGARGYLLKDAPAEKLAEAIRLVHAGGRAIAPELALESWSGAQDPLSERERQVLRLAGEGRTGADIARQLHLSEGTVRNYLSEAISKLNASNRIEAYRMARDAGWL
jgi:two-component system response regulator DesR